MISSPHVDGSRSFEGKGRFFLFERPFPSRSFSFANYLAAFSVVFSSSSSRPLLYPIHLPFGVSFPVGFTTFWALFPEYYDDPKENHTFPYLIDVLLIQTHASFSYILFSLTPNLEASHSSNQRYAYKT